MSGSGDAADAPPPGTASSVQTKVREYWERVGVPSRLAAGHPGGPVFRFTEGPPTANGAPHVGHAVARTIKDVVLRYRRMIGSNIVTPMAGWDCHGLPVELEIEKRHGIKSKKEIEAFGVAKFCDECRASTLSVAAVWQEMSRRLGYWLDYEHPYETMAAPYIESVWWSLRELFDRKLLEKGFYVLPYCPRCETPLSSHEVAQGYHETTDPSVTVLFRLRAAGAGGVPRDLLVWTTTPWTLPANLLIAARADLTYLAVRAEGGGEWLLSEGAVSRYFADHPPTVVGRYSGAELAGATYEPLFPFAGPGEGRYRIVLDDMVDDADGTGFVHIAPSFGPDDQRIGERERVGWFDPLDSRGVFRDEVPPVAGRHFKAADKILLTELEHRERVVQSTTIRHTYPFCWRCGTALIYRALDSWFVRTSRFTSELVANNQTVHWEPEHLKDGRFGNFLDEAKDWALSRNRYWGPPLPIWVCAAGHPTCIGSFRELAERSGQELPAEFDPHRVTVDALVLTCATCGQPARREPYTIDGWYDSGCAPFAQYHYPFDAGPFVPSEPLDFIAEGLDQTRGWFYTLLVLATGLFHRPAYRVCVTNGMALDEGGRKMSKSVGNVLDPMSILERYGGDSVRWTFLSTDYTEPMHVGENAFRLTGSRTLGTLLHIAQFWLENARPDDIVATTQPPFPSQAIDRWLLSRLAATTGEVTGSLAEFDLRRGVSALGRLIDETSTWYLRRSRPRFWEESDTSDRREANATLSYTLATMARLLAPFAPFTAEYLHQEIHHLGYQRWEDSVHATDWPRATEHYFPALESAMSRLRELAEVGRELRQRAGVKSRIPLAEFVVFATPGSLAGSWETEGLELLAEELNVRGVRLEKQFDPASFLEGEWVVRRDGDRAIAALPRYPTPELRRDGLVREALRRLQLLRKQLHLRYTDRVIVTLYASSEWLQALRPAEEVIRREVLAQDLDLRPGPAPSERRAHRFDVDDQTMEVEMAPVAVASSSA